MSAFSNILARIAGVFGGPRIIVRPPPLALPTSVNAHHPQPSVQSYSTTRWLLADLESALLSADTGNLQIAARLWKSCRRDGVIRGVLSTRTEGLVQLPVQYEGDEFMCERLQEDFRTIAPPHELALMAADGDGLGISIGERIDELGTGVGVLRRLDPEFLRYRWNEDRWYYQSTQGLLPVTPGDGRWVLHVPGGAIAPWQNGFWYALGRAYIAKEHAFFLRENYAQKLASAARVAASPAGATDTVRKGFLSKLMAWSNPVFDLPPGWDVKLIESNGRGYEVFQETIKTSNEEIIITIAGQLVTTSGGAGFQNSNIHATIRSDLIQGTADSLAFTVNNQVVPQWANERFGRRGIARSPRLRWDTTPPKDRVQDTTSLLQFGSAIAAANQSLAQYGARVDARALAKQYGFPLRDVATNKELSPEIAEAA